MMNKLLFSFLLLFLSPVLKAQLSVDNTTYTVEQYIQNYLIGTGVTISNVQFNAGSAAIINEQVGSFTDPNLYTGISYGVILGTGNVTMASQLNTGGGSSLGGGTGVGSDSALASITPNTIFDECVIEFDFVPTGDTIKFNYVFASEEYDEYVCGSVNDAFGFFLSGPNPLGGSYSAENIALIPDPNNPNIFTTTPVSINTVNLGVAGSNGTLVNCTNIDANFADYSVFYTQNTGNNYEYDGKTVVLQARAAVTCGQTYHIKLAIGDAGDGAFDSGVFIEGGSFSSNAVQVDIVTTTGDTAIVEGCNSAEIRFIRPSSPDSLVVHYSLAGSTAINGVDYVAILDSVTFLPGSDTVGVIIIPIADGITEGMEVITISAFTISPCGDTIISTGNIYIIDVPNMQSNAPDTTLTCPVDSLWIWAQGSNATPPFVYVWYNSQGDSIGDSNFVQVPGLVTDTFYVDITDSCTTLTIQDTVIVSLTQPILSLQLNDTNICKGDTIQMIVSVTGGYSPYSYTWSNGVTGIDTITISPINPTVYYVSVSDSCSSYIVVDSAMVTMDYTPMELTVSNDTLVCKGDVISLNATVINGIPNYQYLWAPTGSTSASPNVTPTANTTYYVSVTDVCMDTVLIDSVFIDTEFPDFVITATDLTDECEGDLVYISGDAEGGLAPYSFNWTYADTSGIGLDFEFIAVLPDTNQVKLFVLDACNQLDSLIIPIKVNDCIIDATNIFTPNEDGVNDYFMIRGIEFFDSNKMSIYNRWGTLIFERENYRNDWDGYSETGVAFPAGVYFFVFEYTRKSETNVVKGTITLQK